MSAVTHVAARATITLLRLECEQSNAKTLHSINSREQRATVSGAKGSAGRKRITAQSKRGGP